MEWLGTGFTLTIGGLRLRIRIALEDAPARAMAPVAKSPEWGPTTHASPTSGKTGNATWMN